ncbi:MAG TPA: GAF domain-containing sensor histidine kinase [Polyangia bacterium]|nr:GAF domain-containing sensor histidine kinase [Polyangia bacterium]
MSELLALVRERLGTLDDQTRAEAVDALAHLASAPVAGARNRPADPGDEERRARTEAEAAQRRIAFLYQATSTLFAGPLDAAARLTTLARLVVPDVADWCVVDRLVDADSYERAARAHWQPDAHDREIPSARFTVDAKAPLGVSKVLTTGASELVTLCSPPLTAALAASGDPLLARLSAQSYIIVPLKSEDKTMGAVTFAFAESDRRYDADDLAMLEDLAHRASLALENARLYQAAQQAVRVREDLLAIVSHDLRSPLSAVSMAAALLTRSAGAPDPVRLTKYADTIKRSTERMEALIRDLLSFASIEAGHLVIEPKPTLVDDLLRDVLELMQPIAASKQVALDIDHDATGRILMGDRGRLSQVFSNLIGNAIKFSPAGSIVRIGARATGHVAHFTVADSGPGIPKEAQPRIFERFWQAETTARQGTGLGLFIAKGIVEAHRGRIWVESEVGRGSTFQFTVPLA